MRVLIADDDATYRAFLADLLIKWDFEIVLACDGLEAMEVMEGEDPPKMVLLDWDMPGADGFEVARSIRNKEPGKGAYILMVTGSRRKQDMMQVLVCGADDYLIKPFDPMDMKIHLRNAVRIIHLQEDIKELKRSIDRQNAAASR